MEMIDKLRDLSKKLEDPYFIKEFEEGFEKFLKERDMEVYHVKTQEDYDALMIKLEAEGCKWIGGNEPTFFKFWKTYKENTCIGISDKGVTFGNIEHYKKQYPDTPIVEYKAKGDKQMLNTECKQCHKKWHHDNAKYCTLCGKQLMDEPEFKVGDIVSSEILPDGIGIVRLEEYLTGEISEVYGIWYTNNDCEIQEGYFAVFKEDTRHATPTEILEYEMALAFHKHGRKPFEVKEGDILRDDKGNIFFVGFPNNFKKEHFTRGIYTFLKTAEEYNEWLKGE